MMPENWYMYLVAAIIPMLVGAIWYGPLFGKSWMNTNGFTEETLEGGNMAVIFGVSFLLSIFLAMFLAMFSIHQSMIPGLFANYDPNGPEVAEMMAFMAKYADVHRTWSHGAVHGGIAAVVVALPVLGINALFERRGGKYIGIHFGYWFVTMMLMSALLCATLEWAM